MVPGKLPPLRIVDSRPGPGTADTIYITEDGAHWVQDWGSSYNGATCPPRRGRVIDGVIVPR